MKYQLNKNKYLNPQNTFLSQLYITASIFFYFGIDDQYLFYHTDWRISMAQSQISVPLTITLCLMTLPPAIFSSAVDNSSKPRDNRVRSVLFCITVFK